MQSTPPFLKSADLDETSAETCGNHMVPSVYCPMLELLDAEFGTRMTAPPPNARIKLVFEPAGQGTSRGAASPRKSLSVHRSTRWSSPTSLPSIAPSRMSARCQPASFRA